MVSLADPVPSRARFVLPVALLAASSIWLATRPAEPEVAKHRGLGRITGCFEARHRAETPRQIYTGLMIGESAHRPYLHLMEETVTGSFARNPTSSAWTLESLATGNSNQRGFAVSGTLDELAVVGVTGDRPVVACKVTLQLTAYPQGGVIDRVTRATRVDAAADDIALARHNCVVTAVAHAIDEQLIPTIAQLPRL